jgi:hypothetical protein
MKKPTISYTILLICVLHSFVWSIGVGEASAQAFYQKEINNLGTFVPTAHLHEEIILFLARQQEEAAQKEEPAHLRVADPLLSIQPRSQRLAHLFDLVTSRVFFVPRPDTPAAASNSGPALF